MKDSLNNTALTLYTYNRQKCYFMNKIKKVVSLYKNSNLTSPMSTIKSFGYLASSSLNIEKWQQVSIKASAGASALNILASSAASINTKGIQKENRINSLDILKPIIKQCEKIKKSKFKVSALLTAPIHKKRKYMYKTNSKLRFFK
jgi:hypothetical protein